MTTTDPRDEGVAPASRPDFANIASSKVWNAARLSMTILLSGTGFAWLLRLLIDRDPVRGAWTLQVMLCLGAILAAFWHGVHVRMHWIAPLRRLLDATRRAHEGELPIDELSSLNVGGSQPLVPIIQELLRDLRQQQLVIAELNFEMQQKVASRTDALERVIGTLRQQATRDVLTGLFNRRFLDQFLPQAVQRARMVRTDLCLLMIDVDNFKVLNDTLGHAAGDDLLRAIGQLIRSTLRGEDVAFRCGGDEFIILLPGYELKAGRGLGERLTSLVDALAKTIKVSTPPRLSVGVATLQTLPDDSTHESLLAEADRSLYAIKEQRHANDPEYVREVRARRGRAVA